MSGGGPDSCQLLIRVAQRFAAAGVRERLPNPLGDRHPARTCHALNFAVFGILKDHL